jgi:D-glycero-beta-D-manno-heptose-7-phosphate kinase
MRYPPYVCYSELNMDSINNNIEEVIEKFRGLRVLVIGDLMLDTYLIGTAARISPEAPVPVVRLELRDDRLGGAANCAMNIASLGGVPIIVGAIGKAEAGERFIDLVRHQGFELDGIVSHDHILTSRKVRVVAGGQQIVRVDEEESLKLPVYLENRFLSFIEKAVPTVRAVAISDYAKGVITPQLMVALHDITRQKNIPILVDPKPVNAYLYKGCDLMKPNLKETSELAGIEIKDDASCEMAARQVLERYSPKVLLVTRGASGMDLYREEAETVRIKAKVSRVFDVSGAGDTVLATCTMGWAAGLDPVVSCRMAAAAASVVVTKPGTSTVTKLELIESMSEMK